MSGAEPENAWYGHLPRAQGGYGINMREVNSLLNSRKQAALGNQSAADVWGAAMGTGSGDAEVDKAIIDTAYNAQLARAEARRGPSAAVTKPFEVGDSVRRFNMRWKKAGAIPVAISMAESWWRGAIPVAISMHRPLRSGSLPQGKLRLDSASLASHSLPA